MYYLSAEFLMGRSLLNAVHNLGVKDSYAEAIKELGYDLETAVSNERDASLGNGGLGRLAACFLDSMATLSLPGWGYGIRYRYGMFKQGLDSELKQKEMPDIWLTNGAPPTPRFHALGSSLSCSRRTALTFGSRTGRPYARVFLVCFVSRPLQLCSRPGAMPSAAGIPAPDTGLCGYRQRLGGRAQRPLPCIMPGHCQQECSSASTLRYLIPCSAPPEQRQAPPQH